MADEQRVSKRVLVVDDDADIRGVIRSVVESLNLTPFEAPDGPKALELFEDTNPDLIILDVNMPGLSGFDVCRKIREVKEGALIPIIMLTARDSVEDKVTALDGGADEYLTKPFHCQELQARLRAFLRVRELNLRLAEQNRTLIAMQDCLIDQERKLVAMQLGGGAAHELGQPLSAILLNCHLLDVLPPNDPKFKATVESIKSETQRIGVIVESLRSADPSKKLKYTSDQEIVDLAPKKTSS